MGIENCPCITLISTFLMPLLPLKRIARCQVVDFIVTLLVDGIDKTNQNGVQHNTSKLLLSFAKSMNIAHFVEAVSSNPQKCVNITKAGNRCSKSMMLLFHLFLDLEGIHCPPL